MDEHPINVEPENPDARVTIEERGRNFVVLRILPSELKAIGSFQNSVNLAFFTLTVGLGVGFASNLILSHETMSDRKLWLFALLTFTSFILSLYFAVRARVDRQESKNRIDDILDPEHANER